MNNREQFEADAEPYGFSLERYSTSLPTVEPWNEYKDSDTGHRWGGFIAGAESKQAEIAALKQELQALREQKPVAWMYKDSCGKYSTPMLELRPDVPGYHECWKPEPLYAAPVSASEGQNEQMERMRAAIIGLREIMGYEWLLPEFNPLRDSLLPAAPKEPA